MKEEDAIHILIIEDNPDDCASIRRMLLHGSNRMRRIRAIRSMPGIAMSGYGMHEDRRRSQEAGFNEHLVKPIDLPQLISAIRRVTDNRGRNGES